MKRYLRFIVKIILWFGALSVVWVLIYKFVPVPYTPLMAIRYFEAEKDYIQNHEWKSIDEITPNLQLAVICAEDQKFLSHRGFDIHSIKMAYAENKEGTRLRGGSTISQQTAKNVFLWPQRSWLRKGLEAWFTFLIETLWTKERILEVYLNSIEMGAGIYGAEAASRYWFKKHASELSKYEAAAIASILPNPWEYRANSSSAYIERRKNWILKQIQNYGPFILNTKNIK
jgi:monofunctional biosynthetic peptidoglycan transglycosylase